MSRPKAEVKAEHKKHYATHPREELIEAVAELHFANLELAERVRDLEQRLNHFRMAR